MNQQYLESLRRTLDRMYSCRDLEISNLWQRSIFLGTFLVLCFTGYGVLVHSILTLEKDIAEQFIQFHFVCCMLAMLSIIFSVLWIQMAKASKAWYEVYESYIDQFQEQFKQDLDIESIWGMGRNRDLKIDDSLLSTKTGGYSPSKINIVIGQLSLLFWVIVIMIHSSFINFLIPIFLCFFIYGYIKNFHTLEFSIQQDKKEKNLSRVKAQIETLDYLVVIKSEKQCYNEIILALSDLTYEDFNRLFTSVKALKESSIKKEITEFYKQVQDNQLQLEQFLLCLLCRRKLQNRCSENCRLEEKKTLDECISKTDAVDVFKSSIIKSFKELLVKDILELDISHVLNINSKLNKCDPILNDESITCILKSLNIILIPTFEQYSFFKHFYERVRSGFLHGD